MYPKNIMRNRRGVKLIALIATVVIIGGAILILVGGHHHHAPAIQQNGWQIESPRIFAVVPGVATTAGYLSLANHSGTAQVLLSASAAFAEKTEIHNTINDNGIAKMRPLTEGLPIADNAQAEFASGGMHLMFINITRPLAVGDALPVVLTFDGGAITVDFLVSERGGNAHVH